MNRDLTKRVVDAGHARASRLTEDLKSWVELGATGIKNSEKSRVRPRTRPEVATASKNRKCRPRGSVLPVKESRRPDDNVPNIWPNAVSDEVQ